MIDEFIIKQNIINNEQFFYDDSFIDYKTISVEDFFYNINFEQFDIQIEEHIKLVK